MNRLRTRLRASIADGPLVLLDFISGGLDPRITFSRGTTATFVGSNGLIQTAAINAPRFDYDPVTLAAKGLLIEEARTNLSVYSSDFTNGVWTKANTSVTANATTAPEGTNTGTKWREDGALAEHQIYAALTLTAALYTETWYLKAAERTKVRVSLATAGLALGASVIADLSAGTLSAVTNLGGHTGATATISSAGSGWYRVSLTITATAATYFSALTMVTGTNTVLYTGDGTSGIYLYGAQLEAGSFATSYIPTVASTVTRSADVATMTGTNFSSWYNQSEGTVVSEFSSFSPTSASNAAWTISDGTNSNRWFAFAVSSTIRHFMATGGVTQASIDVGTYAANTVFKSAMAISANSVQAAVNGTLGTEDTTATVPTVVRLTVGSSPIATTNFLNGHIRQIAYYNTRLPNSQLQTLTAPSLGTTLSLSFTNQAYTVGV